MVLFIYVFYVTSYYFSWKTHANRFVFQSKERILCLHSVYSKIYLPIKHCPHFTTSLCLCLSLLGPKLTFSLWKARNHIHSILKLFSNLKIIKKGWPQAKLRRTPFPVLSQAKKTNLSFVLVLCDWFAGKKPKDLFSLEPFFLLFPLHGISLLHFCLSPH